MRVLYFTRSWTAHDQRFLSALAQTGHSISYLRLEDGWQCPEELPTSVHFIGWPGIQPGSDLSAGVDIESDLRKLILALQPDVIHAGPIQRVSRLVARVGFHPLVSMSWGSDMLLEADQDESWQTATQEALAGTDVLVADCQAVRERAEQFGFPAERIVLFPWGVDLAHFKPGKSHLREKFGWQDDFVLLSTRTMEPLYGVDVVVRGFVEAAHQHPGLRLLLLGSGSQESNLREILAQGEVLGRAVFLGQVPLENLPDTYRTADLYLSASHSDGSSVSLMEALACGIPALVSDIPGNREWIIPGQAGWLFPDGDAQALSQGILSAVEQRDQLIDMHKRARELAEQRADWSRNFPRLLDAYEKAIERNISPRRRQAR